MKFIYSLCVVVLFLARANSADQDHDEAVVPPKVEAGGTCRSLNILIASNASSGTQVIFTSIEDTHDSPPINFTLAGHYLPPECRFNTDLCDILHLGHPSGTSHYIIPSIGGFVVLSHWANYNNQTNELPWKSFVAITENQCNPTKAFLARNNRILIVACMNLQSRPHGMLYIVNFNLIPNSAGSGWTIMRNTALETKSEVIYNPATVSEIIHVREQARCLQKDNLYFIDDGYVVHFPTSYTSDPEFGVSDINHPLQNCMGYPSFEYYPGNDSLIIRCSNNWTALYDSCGAGRFTYAPDDYIPYPCTNWDTIAYHNGTQLMFNGEIQQLPSDDLNYGRCIQGGDRPVFIASSADGSIFITHGNSVTKITSGNCSNNDDMSCPRPVFSENEHVFGTFNSETDSFMIVNVTEGCMDDPVIAQISTAFVPDLVSVSLGRGNYNCHCSTVQNTEPLSTTQTEVSTSFFSQTEHTVNTKPTSLEMGVGFGALSLVVAVAVIVFIILMYRKCIRPRLNRTKTPEYLVNMQSQQESNRSPHRFNIHLGTSGINRCYGQCGSGTTTNNTSIAESDETASGESEQTLPHCHEESVLNGNGHALPNGDCLPYTSSQLTTEATFDNYQQNCANNNTAAKLQYFRTRGE